MYSSVSCFSKFLIFFSFLLFRSILLVILFTLFRESYKFEYVYFRCKIITIKTLVKRMSFNYQVYNTFLPNGSIVGLSTNYYILLNLTSQNENCPNNYRKCGILDTLGHNLCIDSRHSCHINSLIADYDWKENDLSLQGYFPVNITSGLSYNYRLYYSKEYYYSHSIVNLMKTYYKPKYINYNNFYLDLDAISEFFTSKIGDQSNSSNKNKDEVKKDDDGNEDDNNRRRIDNFNEYDKYFKGNNSNNKTMFEKIYYIYNNNISNYSKRRVDDYLNVKDVIDVGSAIIDKLIGNIGSLINFNNIESSKNL